jgi:hypothetical protein
MHCSTINTSTAVSVQCTVSSAFELTLLEPSSQCVCMLQLTTQLLATDHLQGYACTVCNGSLTRNSTTTGAAATAAAIAT